MAQKKPDSVLELIQKNSNKVIGIGEIGLDKTYTSTEKDFKKQELVFRNQLSLAEKLQKPISIHSRKTLNEIFEICSSYSLEGKLLHWFDGVKTIKKSNGDGIFLFHLDPSWFMLMTNKFYYPILIKIEFLLKPMVQLNFQNVLNKRLHKLV